MSNHSKIKCRNALLFPPYKSTFTNKHLKINLYRDKFYLSYAQTNHFNIQLHPSGVKKIIVKLSEYSLFLINCCNSHSFVIMLT